MSKGHLYAPLSWVKKKFSEIWDAITEQNSKKTEMKLLWTNPNPSAVFGAKTIPIDLTDYDGVLIKLYDAFDRQFHIGDYTILKGETAYCNYTFFYNNGIYIYDRNITVNETGVVCEMAHINSQDNDGKIIPYKIYGVKNIV